MTTGKKSGLFTIFFLMCNKKKDKFFQTVYLALVCDLCCVLSNRVIGSGERATEHEKLQQMWLSGGVTIPGSV